MRRLSPVLTSLVVVALVIVACGGSTVEPQTAPPEAEPEAGQSRLVYFYADW